MIFNIGDRVICSAYGFEDYKGKIVEAYDESSGVEFDEYVSGHNCCGNCEEGYGWYVSNRYLKLYNKNRRVISK